jgi:hypothetical protein
MKSENADINQSQNQTAPVVVSMWGNASMRVGPTAGATARWTNEHRMVGKSKIRRKDASDRKVSNLMSRLYFDAKCGNAAAEYNLEKAGMIEMIFDQAAGEMRDGDNYWNDIRWMRYPPRPPTRDSLTGCRRRGRRRRGAMRGSRLFWL